MLRFTRESLKLYIITDQDLLRTKNTAEEVEKALVNGATFVQIREKGLSSEAYAEKAADLRKVCSRYDVPFVVNDDVNAALASGADGVHMGQTDLRSRDVRSLIGEDKILGISANSVELAVKAEEAGADYIGVGSIQLSPTKKESKVLTLEEVKTICESVSVPVVAIGGINADNISMLKGTGVAGAAVISAVFGSADAGMSARELRRLADLYL